MTESIRIVLPLFIMTAVGILVGKLGFLDDHTMKQLNRIIYDVLFPCSFFASTYNSAGKINIGADFIILIFVLEIVSFAATYCIAKYSSKDVAKQGALHQGMFRSNMILFGTAIASSMLSSDEVGVYTVSLLIILPLQNIGSVIGKELFGSNEEGVTVWSVLKGVMTNTHVVAIILGLIVGNLGIRIPDLILKVCTDFGSCGSPIQLLVLGATLRFDDAFSDIKLVSIGVLVKLFLMPAAGLASIYLLHLSYAESFVILLLCAAPTAVTIFTISMRSKWDVSLANKLILYSTIVALLSLTMWMYFLERIAF